MKTRAKLPSLRGLIAVLSIGLAFAPMAYAITNGHPDGNAHAYVGVVEFEFGETDTFRCSGSLIAPTVVLTAAHCVYFMGRATAAKVSFDSEVTDNSTWIDAIDFYTHPSFCLGCGPGFAGIASYDIAVVQLSKPVTDKGLASLPEIGVTQNLPNGTRVTLVGYGAVGRSKGNPPHAFQYNGLRNFATTRLIRNESVLSDEFIKLTANVGDGKGGGCFADSGGPSLLADTNIILATITLGTGANCSGVAWSYRLDTELVQNFIKGFLP